MSFPVRLAVALALVTVFAIPAVAQALAPGAPLQVRVLYDNSGSMYPGYRPPGSRERRTRSELGVGYFHESPRFAEWLDQFAKRQTIVDGASIGMWTFTSADAFVPSDIEQVHAVVPVSRFDAGRAVSHFPEHRGSHTHLTEAVESLSSGFTGLLWLITDNIVETGEGQPDAGVQAFFETLASRPEIRAVHLLKYSFEERGQTASIAVYGMLISQPDVSPATLEHYDRKFELLREAKRTDTREDLFSGREHLKLKDLRIRPLKPQLRLVLSEDEGTFKEGQTIKLDIEGAIRSYLTQHTVLGGHYKLEITSAFQPEEWATHDLGAQPLASDRFAPFVADLAGTIPPLASRAVNATLQSRQPVAFSPRGLATWLRLAWSGATVRYNGTAQMSFSGIRMRLEPQRMAGIFGIDRATRAFAFQDMKTLSDVAPSQVPVTFVLRTDNSRTALLLIALAILAAIATGIFMLLSRKRTFRIALSREPERLVALRPLTGHDIVVDGRMVGRLSRGIGKYSFRPSTTDAAVTVTAAAEADAWDVTVSGASHRLKIRAQDDGKTASRPATANSRAAPPPPPSPRTGPPPAPTRAPRIGRN